MMGFCVQNIIDGGHSPHPHDDSMCAWGVHSHHHHHHSCLMAHFEVLWTSTSLEGKKFRKSLAPSLQPFLHVFRLPPLVVGPNISREDSVQACCLALSKVC